MPGRYLLDTNTASYVIKGNIPRIRERLLKMPMAQLAISAVTEAELLFGAARRPEAVRLKVAVENFSCEWKHFLGIQRRPGIMPTCAPRWNAMGSRWGT